MSATGPGAEPLSAEGTGSGEDAAPPAGETTPPPEDSSAPNPEPPAAKENPDSTGETPPERISAAPPAAPTPETPTEPAVPEEAPSETPPKATVTPEDDGDGDGETRTAPTLAVQDDTETLSFPSDESRTLQITVADLVDAPADITLEAGCTNPALFNPAALLSSGENGVYTLTFAPLGAGSGTVALTATNTAGLTATASIAVTVTQRNRTPVFVPPVGALATDEDTPLPLNLDDYFIDPDGDTLVYTVKTPAQHGTTTIAGTALTYTPDAHYDQNDSFTITATDGEFAVDGSFAITVTPQPSAPSAADDTTSCTTASGAIDIDVLANDTVVDTGATLTITAVTHPPAGLGAAALMANAGRQFIRYTPSPRQAAGPVAFTYTLVHTGGTLEATATVTVDVTLANNAPAISGLAGPLAGTEGTPLAFSFTVTDLDVAAPPQDNLIVAITSGNTAILQQSGISVTPVYVNADTVRYDVELTFEPYANTSADDLYGTLDITLTVTDKNDALSTASQTVGVNIAPVDNPPEIRYTPALPAEDRADERFDEDTGHSFTFEVVDPDMPLPAGDPGYTVAAVSNTAAVLPNSAANVKVAFVSKAANARTAVYRVTLTPLPNANTYQAAYANTPVTLGLSVLDLGWNAATRDVLVDVAQVNDAPTAGPLSYTVDEDTVIRIPVTTAGSDIDGNETIAFDQTLTDAISAMGGSITFEDGGKTLVYTPAQYYYGADSFSYTIVDDGGLTTGPHLVSITLNFINYPPTFTNLQTQPYATAENTPITIPLTVFDVETALAAIGMQVSVSAGTDLIAAYSLADVDPARPDERLLTITPAANRNSYGGRNAQFKLVLGDGTANATFTLSLTITPVNNAPAGGTLARTFNEDNAITITAADILSVCSDVDITLGENDALFIQWAKLGAAANGTLNIHKNGDDLDYFVYTPNLYFDGVEEISFVVQDKAGAEGTGLIRLTAVPVNNRPVLGAITGGAVVGGNVLMDEDTTTVISIPFFDPETPRDELILAVTSSDESVLNKDSFAIALTPDGCALTITPRPDQFREAPGVTVRFTVSDGENSVTRTFNVVVNPVPDAPRTPSLAYTVRDATTLRLDPLSECTDPDPGDEMTLVSVVATTPLNGTLTDLGGGIWGYTSEPGFKGEVVLAYTVTDSHNLPETTSTGTITITVGNTIIGASIGQLPALVFFSGQTVPTYTLTISGVNPGEPYTLAAEVLSSAGGGSPVSAGSFSLDGGGSTLAVPGAGPAPQTHTLNFGLTSGIIGESVVRVTITYTDDQNETQENYMNFKVTATRDNTPPAAGNPSPVYCDEGDVLMLDVLTDVLDVEDPLWLQMQIQSVTCAPGTTRANVTIVQNSAGRWALRFTTDKTHNAHNSPQQYTLTYTVVDSGGETDDASIDVFVRSQDHAPYTHSYVTTVTRAQASAVGGVQINLAPSSNDYDADTRHLAAVREAAGPGAYTAEIDSVSGQLAFTAATPGWYTVYFTVKSSFDGGTTWKTSASEGTALIGVQDDSGNVPPYFYSHTRYIYEDADTQEIDLTGYLYASVGKNMSWEVVSTSPHIDKLENYTITRRGTTGNWQYILTLKPKPDANSNGGNPQIQIKWVDEDLKALGTVAEEDYSTTGTITLHIYAVNDDPVISEAPPTLAVARGGYETFTLKVTDVDYPDQTACDAQIRMSLLSSNNNVVHSESCVITPPTSGSGVWRVTARGLFEGTCTLTLTATDRDGASVQTTVVVTVSGDNTAPVAKDHYAVFSEDKKAAMVVYDAHTDAEGDPLTVILRGDTAGLPGYVAVEGDKITFMPDADFCHEDTYADATGGELWPADQYVEIQYQLLDTLDLDPADIDDPAWAADFAGHLSEVKSVRIHFNPVNDAPRFVALLQNHTMDEGKTGTIKLKVTDVVSPALTFDTPVWWDTTDGKIEAIVLEALRTGNATTDGKGSAYEVTLSITNTLYAYHATGDAPTALAITARDDENASVTANLLLTINPTNNAPLLRTNGLTLLDNNPNHPIIYLEVNEDTALDTLLASFYWDPDGDTLHIISLTEARHGTTSNPGNAAHFMPDADYFTPHTADETAAADDALFGWYTYAITDGAAEVAGSVKIRILPVNDAPRLKAAGRTTQEDTPLLISLWGGAYDKNATIWDVDNTRDELAIISVGTAGSSGTDNKTAQGGTLELHADGTLTYTPAADFFGADNFRYVVSDGLLTATQTVNLTVEPVDDAPRANFQGSASWCPAPAPRVEITQAELDAVLWAFDEDTTGSFAFRVWDPEGNGILTSYTTTAPETLLPLSRVTLDGSGESLRLVMKPLQDQFGGFTVTITLDDGNLKKHYTLNVRVRPVNDLPVIATETNLTVNEDETVSGTITATDVEDKAEDLVFSLADDTLEHPWPANGTATVDAAGNYSYTPSPNYYGTDVFYIQVTDTEGGASYAKMSVTINPVNDAPTPPTNLAFNKTHYGNAEVITLRFTAGTDLPNETAREDLLYDIDIRLKDSDSAWTAVYTRKAVTYAAGSCSIDLPAALLAGVNTDELRVRVRTWDTGAPQTAVYAKSSAYAEADNAPAKVDSTPPVAAHTLAPGAFTNGAAVTITLAPADNSPAAAWQAGFSHMNAPAGVTTADTATHTYTVAANGRYVFALFDNVGNQTDYPVDVLKLDRIVPTITADAPFDNTAGKVVRDDMAITLVYADPADTTAPIDGGEAQSGLVAREYQLLRNTAPPAGWQTSTTGWATYTAPAALELKGSYIILARATDAAGNVTTEQFGPYVINNSAPVAVNKTVNLYREDVSNTTLKKMLQSLTLQAADDDTEDTLAYYWETSDADYTALAAYASLTGSGAAWQLQHQGGHLVNDLASQSFTLRYYARDDDTDNPLESARATVTVTLHPVNHVPQPPSAPSPAATTLQGGAGFTLSWAHGSDVETADTQLRYQIRWRLSNADTAWLPAITTAAGATSHTLTLPATSTEFFQFELRTLDDNPTSRVNPDNTTGPALSAAVLSDVFRIDATNPAISITQSPTGWTNGAVTVSVNITDEGTGQSGIKEITLNGTTVAGYTATDTARGSYTITLPATTENDTAYTYVVTDHVGNTATKTHTVTTIDRLLPGVAATPPDGTVLGYAGTPINVTLSYTDATAIPGQDGSSGVPAAQKWVRWYKVGDTPGDYVLYDSVTPNGITFNVRGKYYIDAWCQDSAGNGTALNAVTFGPYEVANSPPQAAGKTVALYEHDVTGQGNSSITITLSATEPDGDNMTFAFTNTTALGSWGTLAPAADTAWPGDTWTLTHDGSEFSTTSVTLTYTATDDFVDYLDNSESAPATVTVNLVPVNDAPEAPTSFALTTAGPYKGGQSITLSWLPGSDIETNTNALVYVIAWPDATAAGGWNSHVTNPGETTAAITLPAGINTNNFELRIRTQDDNSTHWNPNGSTGPALSAAARIENIKVDSTAPTATHTLEKSGWTNDDVLITLTTQDGTAAELWQSGVSHITPPGGVTTEAVPGYVYKTTGNGRFVFTLHDLAGNTRDYSVDVMGIDTAAPTITPSETAIAAGAGKLATDNVAISLTYTDPVDSTAPIDGGNATSGLTATQYKLLRDEAPPAGWETDITGWSPYSTSIPLALKGSYTLLARAQDAAGNVTTASYGPYVINNTTPVAHPKAYTVYEHTVSTFSNTAHIQMTGEDNDTEDAPQLTFAWVQNSEYDRLLGLGFYSGNAWGTLEPASGGTAGDGSHTFTHNGAEVETLLPADRVFTLSYTTTDPAGATSTAATVTLTLVPVNHRPSKPDSIAAVETLYRQGDPVTLSWALGTNLDTETDDADLVYDVEYTLDGAAWTALPASPYSGAAPSVAIAAPAGNSATYRFRVRTKDTNPAGTGFIDESTGTAIPGVSPWVESPNYKLDNTKPTATRTLVPAADTGGDIIVTLAPRDATPSASWQSGIDRVEHPATAGLTVENAATYQYRITQNGSYLFKIYDVAGNLLEYTVTTGVPADPIIGYGATHTRRGQQVAVSWTHPTTTAHYELQVYNGSSWSTLVAAAAKNTAKTYTYTVPATFADTAALCFRVRAWDSAGLHSANWSAGHNIICDTTKPTITLTPSTPGSVYTNQDVTVTIGITDALARLTEVTITQDGTGSPLPISPAAGAYNTSAVFSANGTLTVTARDACGNVAAASYNPTNIDKLAPVATAEVTTNGKPYTARSGHPLHFAISFGDDGVSGIASREYAITSSSAAPTSWTAVNAPTATETRSELGQYHLHLRASDVAGNVTTLYAGMFEVYNTPPQTQAQTVEVDEGGAVTFDVLAVENDPNDNITKWVIVTEPTHGTLTRFGGNTFHYVHDGKDPIADDHFTYYVEDSRDGVSDTALVTIKVAEVNDPPFILNLPQTVDIPWNTTTPVAFEIADADDLTLSLAWLVRTGSKTVLPLNAVAITVVPRAGGHEADVVMNLSPVRDAFTEADSPVAITLRLRDAEGLQAEQTLWVNVLRAAQPPKAQDQYHFVLPGGTVRGAIAATPDHGSSIAGYTFGTLSEGSQCALSTAADGSFSLKAGDGFVSDAFPVCVHDANGLSTDITVHISSQAISQENVPVDRLVSSIPGLAALDPAGVSVSVESSSHPDILPVENCDFVLAAGGELQLYYNPTAHRYGEVTLTLSVTLADGTVQKLSIPISIKPVNDPPVVTVKTDSPLNDGVYDVYIGESMTGQLLADDSLDASAYACQDFSFTCLPGHLPQFGTLAVEADGRYTYTPDAGFVGEDEFCITVAELTGWAENQNPTSLPAGVIDVSNGVPLLAQVVHIQVSVGERPPPAKPEKPAKPEDPASSQPPEAPAAAPPAGAPAATAPGQSAGSWTPALEVKDTPEGGGTTYETPEKESPEKLPEAEPPDEPDPLDLTEAPLEELSPAGWVWPAILGAAALVLVLLLLLLFGCRIRVTAVWRDDAGRPQTRTRTLWFRRLSHAGEDTRRLDITMDDTGPLAGLAFRLHFGPLYRRHFYTQPIQLAFGAHTLHTHLPEKDAYRQNGLKAQGSGFTPE
ncbi:MAG: tandem-95 repeat protein [Ruminococcaceae bacterium]|nr:tandem-95 repeat protein [Oscillospiraceae bacterium]